MKSTYVYIAGPLTGNLVENVRYAVCLADYLLRLGYAPYCPHLTHFWELICGLRSWDVWLSFDEKWLLKCDVLYRLPGKSLGADREVAFAKSNKIPVVHSLSELLEGFPLSSNEPISEQADCPSGPVPCPPCSGVHTG